MRCDVAACRPGLAAITTLVVFLALLVGVSTLIVPSIADEVGTLGPTVTQAIDDVQDWLVDESPFDVSREAIDRLRERAGERLAGLFQLVGRSVRRRRGVGRGGDRRAVPGAVPHVLHAARRRAARSLGERSGTPRTARDASQRAAERGWWTLGGYIRGAAALGVIEAIAIGLALLLSGGGLVGHRS